MSASAHRLLGVLLAQSRTDRCCTAGVPGVRSLRLHQRSTADAIPHYTLLDTKMVFSILGYIRQSPQRLACSPAGQWHECSDLPWIVVLFELSELHSSSIPPAPRSSIRFASTLHIWATCQFRAVTAVLVLQRTLRTAASATSSSSICSDTSSRHRRPADL